MRVSAIELTTRLNHADLDQFTALVGPLYEHSPWIAALAFEQRPFADLMTLRGVMQGIVVSASRDRQLSLIRAHPDLAGKLARAGTLTPHSTGEQSGIGLDRLTDDEFGQFDALNTAYRARFGFPFIIAVRAQTKQGVLAAFEIRLHHDETSEIRIALEEIGKIAAFRLDDLTA